PETSLIRSEPEIEAPQSTDDAEHSASSDEDFQPQPPLEAVSLGDFYQNARQWVSKRLDQTRSGRLLHELWLKRRGDISLAISACVVAVLLLWTFWPSRTSKSSAATPTTATVATTTTPSQPNVTEKKRRPKPPSPELTTWEKVLVGLGLAEAPPPAPYMG